jgi:Secretion system C-terminal sorting domain
MKTLFTLTCFVVSTLFLCPISAQVRWIGATTGGLWTTASNWSTGIIPLSTDSVLLSSSSNDTLAIRKLPAIFSLAKLRIAGNTKVRFWGDTTTILTLTGGAGTDLWIDSTAALIFAADTSFRVARGIQLNLATGATAEIWGHLHFTSHGSWNNPHRLQALSTNAIVFRNKSTFTMGTGAAGNPFGTGTAPSATQTVLFEDGSTYNFNSGSNPFGATSMTVTTFSPKSNYKINVSGSAFSNRTYGHVELLNPSYNSTSSGSGVFTVNGNLTIKGGKMKLNLTGGVQVKGNVQVATGALLTLGSEVTLTFNGTTEQTLIHQNNLVFTDSSSILKIANSAGVRLKNSLVLPHLELATGSLILDSSHMEVTRYIAGGSASSHVVTNGSGMLKRPNIGAMTVIFPVGVSKTSYDPVSLTNAGVIDTFSIRVDTVVMNPPAFRGNCDFIMNRAWQLQEKVAGGSNVMATFGMDISKLNLNNTIFTPTNVILAQYNNNAWAELTASRNAETVTVMGLTQFSTFAIANAGAFTRVGVSDTRLEYGLKTYPNPTQDVLNIEILNPPLQVAEMVILDAQGRVQDSQPFNSTMRFITSHWLSGIYFLAIQRNGSLQILDKIVKND